MDKTDKGGTMATMKGILILALLLIAAGAGGYFFGTYQKFAPVQTVAPGTPSALPQQTTQSTTITAPLFGSSLKKKYWIASRGDKRIGYAITVFLNGQLVDKFFEPNKRVEITRFVKPGENQIAFDAKHLPDGMIEHKGNTSYWLTLEVQSGSSLESTQDVTTLLSYKRTAADERDYNDQLSFVTLE